MRICDRCGKPALYSIYIASKNRDLCKPCNKKYEDLCSVFNDIERDFMEKKINGLTVLDSAILRNPVKE